MEEMEERINPDEKRRETRIELIIVILLGITAIATAWSSWQESLHGSQQDQKYALATQMTGEANSLYNEAAQYIAQDMALWNEIQSLRVDLLFAEDKGDADEVEKVEWKLDMIMADNLSDEMSEAIDWADSQEDYASPFDNEDFIYAYYEEANALYEEASETMTAGDTNNTHADNQGLVTVIYAVVLFLLGISASFNVLRIKRAVVAISAIAFVVATVYMFTIPIVFP